MRAATSGELALLASAAYHVHVKVEIQDGDGIYRDYSSENGINWINTVTIDEDLDQQVAQATVTLKRQVGALSLSPLRTDSTENENGLGAFSPAIDVGRRQRVSTACTAVGATPLTTDWKVKHEGVIDTVDFADGYVKTSARDDGGVLVDAYFDQAFTLTYAPDPPTSIVTVIQNVLDSSNLRLPAPVTVYVPSTPTDGEAITKFGYDVESAMDALQRLAGMIGWDLRYRWDDGTSSFRLTFKDPGRTKTTPDRILSASQIIKVSTLKIDRTNVRNDVTVWYGDAAFRLFENWNDTGSQARYGVRRIVIQEDSDSAINTGPEALAMAQYIIADLKDPRADHAVDLFYDWTIELQDLLRASANHQHYDTDQDYAVVSIKHTLTPKSARSTISTRGAPVGAYRNWLLRAASPPPDSEVARSIVSITYEDSADNLQRTIVAACGALVDFLTIHELTRTAPIVDGQFVFTDDDPATLLVPDANGIIRYTVDRPVGDQETGIQFEPRAKDGTAGSVRRVIVPALPPVPPTVKAWAEKDATGASESVFAQLDSVTNEPVRAYFRDTDSEVATIYGLCVSGTDSTPLYVPSGTTIGPTSWFVDVNGGTPAQTLSAIALTRDQLKRVYLQGEGEHSGVKSTWATVSLSLMEKPWLSSTSLTWDAATGHLLARCVGGAHCQSVKIEFSAVSDFSVIFATSIQALADDGDVIVAQSLTGANRGKTWYARFTPSNNATWAAGLPGSPEKRSAPVPGEATINVRVVDNSTLAVDVDDPGSWVNATSRVQFYVTDGAGVRTLHNADSAPGGTTGTYEKFVTLDEKHVVTVEPVVTFADGSVKLLGGYAFDPDLNANVLSAVPAYNGQTATVTCVFDTDTVTGAGFARYRINGGSWVTFTVGADLVGQFNVTASESAKQTVEIAGQNADGQWGPSKTIEIDKYDSPGPSLSVQATISSSTVSIAYSGAGTITLGIDGGSFTTPSASPISVTRDTATHSYVFKAIRGNQTITHTVEIPALPPTNSSLFSFVSVVDHDDTANTIRVQWTYDGLSTATFDVYSDDGNPGAFSFKGTSSSGATFYDFTSFWDLVASGGTSATVRAYVVASGGGVSDIASTVIQHA